MAAELAKIVEPHEHMKIIGFLKKAFDRTYINSRANFLLAVEYFKANRFDDAEEIFRAFRRRVYYRRDPKSYDIEEFVIDEDGKNKKFEGEIKTITRNYGFIDADLLKKDIYFIPNKIRGGKAKQGLRLKFEIGFNFFGPIAYNITIN